MNHYTTMDERQKRTRINEYPIGRLATEGYKAPVTPPEYDDRGSEKSEDQST